MIRWNFYPAAIFALVGIWAIGATALAESAPPTRLMSGEQSGQVSSRPTGDTPVAWTLVDHNGQSVSEEDLQGRFQLMVFGYTFCPDICPTALLDVAEVMDSLGERSRYILPVFVTIDPSRDTSAVLNEYLTNFHPSTVGLTGTEAQISAIRKAYGVISVPGPKSEDGTYFMAHSARKYLLSPDGKLVTSFSHDAAPAVLENYLKELFRRMGV